MRHEICFEDLGHPFRAPASNKRSGWLLVGWQAAFAVAIVNTTGGGCGPRQTLRSRLVAGSLSAA
ncbi:MAG TPA: hypothetical protein PLS93_17600, partial [Accumulibacter sp.]|nr:hypothetical protein [Accumulibacter sp.]